MLSAVWPQSVPLMPRSHGTAPVPDINGLRRTALQASWRRDRRVAQRRMAMRWAAWYAIRGLPLMTIAAAVWLWVLPTLNERALAAANAPARQASPTSSATVAPGRSAAAVMPPMPAVPDPKRSEPELQLRLENPFQPAPPTVSAQATTQAANTPAARVQRAVNAASATESPSPQLKPDNWLHSQEP